MEERSQLKDPDAKDFVESSNRLIDQPRANTKASRVYNGHSYTTLMKVESCSTTVASQQSWVATVLLIEELELVGLETLSLVFDY